MRQTTAKLSLKKETIACLGINEINAIHGGAATTDEIHATGTTAEDANLMLAVAISPKKPISK